MHKNKSITSVVRKCNNHQYYMNIALNLARQARGSTYPNPPVGAVLVKDNQIISSAVTEMNSGLHAENKAIEESTNKEITRGADLYVTLEPCCHHGKNPPCTDKIIAAGIKRVFVACVDVFERVSSKGIKALQNAGVEVMVGICEEEAISLNLAFNKRIIYKLPYIMGKFATSLDGCVALGNSKSRWITSQKARQYAHMLRKDYDAILIGSGTLHQDDPLLTCRIEGYEHFSPIRIILDSSASIKLSSNIVQTSSQYTTWLVIKEDVVRLDKIKQLEDMGVRIISMHDYNLNAIMHHIAKLGISSVLVEGGAKVLTSYLQNKLLDEICHIQAPIIIGSDGYSMLQECGFASLEECHYLHLLRNFRLGRDLVTHYSVLYQSP